MPGGATPEAVAQQSLTVSLVQLIIEARGLMRGTAEDAESARIWRQVIGWLEAKLPEGVTVADLDDPMLSSTANERFRTTTGTAADVAPGPDGVRRPVNPGIGAV